MDVGEWLADNWQVFDPSHAHRLFWPDREYKKDMDILIAGCGRNQAAIFSYTNPSAKITAIDVSQVALAHHEFLKKKHNLMNLDLILLPMERCYELNRSFDLIVSTGSIHHLLNPELGVRALASCLKPDGVVALMVYAKYGRIGVDMMQSVFRDLSFQQDMKSIKLVKECLSCLPDTHPAITYAKISPDLYFDSGWVDTYLSSREKSYSINECFDLVEAGGLVFQDIFQKSSYYPPLNSPNKFHSLISKLPDSNKWSIMERINFSNACHFFMACHPGRPSDSYGIDFKSPNVWKFVPSLRYRCGLEGEQLFRPGWRINLDNNSLALAKKINGKNTIGEILSDLSQKCIFGPISYENQEKYVLDTIQVLWQNDFLAIALPSR